MEKGKQNDGRSVFHPESSIMSITVLTKQQGAKQTGRFDHTIQIFIFKRQTTRCFTAEKMRRTGNAEVSYESMLPCLSVQQNNISRMNRETQTEGRAEKFPGTFYQTKFFMYFGELIRWIPLKLQKNYVSYVYLPYIFFRIHFEHSYEAIISESTFDRFFTGKKRSSGVFLSYFFV